MTRLTKQGPWNTEETEPKDQMTKPRPETKNIRQSRKTTKRARTKNIH